MRKIDKIILGCILGGMALALGGLVAFVSAPVEPTEAKAAKAATVTVNALDDDIAVDDDIAQAELEAEANEPDAEITAGEENARRAAENYLEIAPFSRKGLIRQLMMGDGYERDEAAFAVGSISVDWRKQAALAAENYLEISPFSRDGLYRQLVMGDGYEPWQAAYGVEKTGL